MRGAWATLSKLNPFRPLPCGDICRCRYKLTRFHITCLTCPLRRTYRNKTRKYIAKKHVFLEADYPNSFGAVVPKHYVPYVLMVNTTRMYRYHEEPVYVRFKLCFLKNLLRVCERISRW